MHAATLNPIPLTTTLQMTGTQQPALPAAPKLRTGILASGD